MSLQVPETSDFITYINILKKIWHEYPEVVEGWFAEEGHQDLFVYFVDGLCREYGLMACANARPFKTSEYHADFALSIAQLLQGCFIQPWSTCNVLMSSASLAVLTGTAGPPLRGILIVWTTRVR